MLREVGQFFLAKVLFDLYIWRGLLISLQFPSIFFHCTCFSWLDILYLVSLYILKYFLHYSFSWNFQFSSQKIQQLFISWYKLSYSELRSILFISKFTSIYFLSFKDNLNSSTYNIMQYWLSQKFHLKICHCQCRAIFSVSFINIYIKLFNWKRQTNETFKTKLHNLHKPITEICIDSQNSVRKIHRYHNLL